VGCSSRIVHEDIGKVYKKYERNGRLYKQKISQMEKIMPSFQYEHLVLSLKPETLDEEEDRGDTYGAWPLGTKVAKETWNLRGGKDSPEKEAIEQTLE